MRKFIDQVMFRLEQGWGFIDAVSLTNWLRAVQSGKERERNRIIDLLESKICWCINEKVNFRTDDKEQFMRHLDCDFQAMMVEYHISLIKGEQK